MTHLVSPTNRPPSPTPAGKPFLLPSALPDIPTKYEDQDKPAMKFENVFRPVATTGTPNLKQEPSSPVVTVLSSSSVESFANLKDITKMEKKSMTAEAGDEDDEIIETGKSVIKQGSSETLKIPPPQLSDSKNQNRESSPILSKMPAPETNSDGSDGENSSGSRLGFAHIPISMLPASKNEQTEENVVKRMSGSSENEIKQESKVSSVIGKDQPIDVDAISVEEISVHDGDTEVQKNKNSGGAGADNSQFSSELTPAKMSHHHMSLRQVSKSSVKSMIIEDDEAEIQSVVRTPSKGKTISTAMAFESGLSEGSIKNRPTKKDERVTSNLLSATFGAFRKRAMKLFEAPEEKEKPTTPKYKLQPVVSKSMLNPPSQPPVFSTPQPSTASTPSKDAWARLMAPTISSSARKQPHGSTNSPAKRESLYPEVPKLTFDKPKNSKQYNTDIKTEDLNDVSMQANRASPPPRGPSSSGAEASVPPPSRPLAKPRRSTTHNTSTSTTTASPGPGNLRSVQQPRVGSVSPTKKPNIGRSHEIHTKPGGVLKPQATSNRDKRPASPTKMSKAPESLVKNKQPMAGSTSTPAVVTSPKPRPLPEHKIPVNEFTTQFKAALSRRSDGSEESVEMIKVQPARELPPAPSPVPKKRTSDAAFATPVRGPPSKKHSFGSGETLVKSTLKSQAKNAASSSKAAAASSKTPTPLSKLTGAAPASSSSSSKPISSMHLNFTPPNPPFRNITPGKQAPNPTTVLPDIFSESEDDEGGSVIMEWAQSPELRAILSEQQKVDPDSVFGDIAPLRMEEVFKSGLSRFRSRSSSAAWTGQDQLSQQEIDSYAKEMGYK